MSLPLFPLPGRMAKAVCRRHRSPFTRAPRAGRSRAMLLAAERLEKRHLLSVNATLVGTELQITVDATGDAVNLSNDGANYIVRGSDLSGYAVANTLVASISVRGNSGANQSFSVGAGVGAVVTDALLVDASIEKTTINGFVNSSGNVTIGSPSITLAEDVRTMGSQTYSGNVGIVGNRTLSAGGLDIGSVTFGGTVDSSPELFADPDSFTSGTVLTTAFAGIRLTDSNPAALSPVTSRRSGVDTPTSGDYAPTGNRVFGTNFRPDWLSPGEVLRVDFTRPVTNVSLDFSGTIGTNSGCYLTAYDTSGMEIANARYPLSIPERLPLTLTVSGPGIAYVLASVRTSMGLLDNLRATRATTPPAGLIVNASGVTEFAGAVGGAAPLAFLSTDAVGSTIIRGDVTTTGFQSFTDPALLAGTQTTLTAAAVSFGDTLDGPTNLEIVAGNGPVAFAGAVGNSAALGSLWIRSAGSVTAESPISLARSAPSPRNNVGLMLGPGVRNVTMTAPGSSIRNFTDYGIQLDSVPGSRLAGFRVSGSGAAGLIAIGNLAGTAITDSTFISNATGVVLSSARGLTIGKGNALLQGTGSGLLAAGDSTGTVVTGSVFSANPTGIVLADATNLTLDSSSGTPNTIVTNTAQGVLATGNLAGTAIRGASVYGNPTGILMSAARGLTIGPGNYLQNSSSAGLVATGDSTGSVLTGSIVSGNGIGVLLSSATGLEISARGGAPNTIVSNTNHGIFATGGGDGTLVTGNTIDSNPYGIFLSTARNLTVGSGNTITSSVNAGVFATGDLTGTRLQGSVLDRNTTGLLMSAAAGLTVGGAGAAGNTIANSVGSGVMLTGACTGSTIAANWIGLNAVGIMLSGATGATISGAGTVAGNTSVGLYATGVCTGSSITAAVFAGNASGMMFSGARGLSVSGTRITGNRGYGIWATGVSTGTSVTGNVISGNGVNVDTSTATGGTFQAS